MSEDMERAGERRHRRSPALSVSTLCHYIVRWWHDESHADWVVSFLDLRGLLDWLRVVIAAVGPLVGTIAILASFGPPSSFRPATTWVMWAFAAAGLGWSVLWVATPFPTIRSSLVRMAVADVVLALAVFCHTDPVAAVATGVLFVITSAYLTLFHGPRAMAVHSALATAVLISVCVGSAVTHGIATSTTTSASAKTLGVLALVVVIMPLFNFMFWLIRNSDVESLTDPLTSVANRRGLDEQIRRLIDHRPGRSTWSLILIDLDDFKAVNDRHGHAVGDDVIIQTARVITSCVDDNHVVARIGGEEFVVLMNDAAPVARTTAEKIRRGVESMTDPTITASLGFASTTDALTGDGFVDRLTNVADVALYAAKAAGGNRVNGPATRRTVSPTDAA